MKLKSTLFIIVMAFCTSLFAQDNTLLFTNGKKVTIGNYKIQNVVGSDSLLIFTTIKGKEKDRYLDEVFSIIDKEGRETLMYNRNPEVGDVLTVEQMRAYVNGRSDGRQTSISPFISISAATVGVLSAFIPNPTTGNGSTIPVNLLVPIAYTAALSGFSTPDKVLQKNYPSKIDDEYYVMGADESLRKKRVKHSLIAGLVGFAAGFIVVASID